MTDEKPTASPAPRSSRFESHVQTVLIGVTTAGIISLVGQGVQMTKTQAEQVAAQQATSAAIAELKNKIDRMDGRFAEFPSRAESDTRFRSLELRVDEHTRRIERLEAPRR